MHCTDPLAPEPCKVSRTRCGGRHTGSCKAGNGLDNQGRSVPLRLGEARNHSPSSLACGEAIHRGKGKAVFGGPSVGAAWGTGSCHTGSSAQGPGDDLVADPELTPSSVAQRRHFTWERWGRGRSLAATSVLDLFLGCVPGHQGRLHLHRPAQIEHD